MRILFLSHYFPPEVNAPAVRTHEHARRWVADGHQVTVITGVPNHPKGELHPGYENRWFQEEEIDGIRVIRTWMYLTPNAGFVRRIANYVLFMLTAIVASHRAERPDVVVATSPQFFCGLAGMLVGRLKRRPFILEIRDLWPDSIVQLGQLQQGWIVRSLEWLETRLYRSARGIVVNTRAFIDHIADRGVPRDRIALVYNGIDPELFKPRPSDEALRERHGLTGKFVVTYMGTMGLAHGLMSVIDTAEKLSDEPDFEMLLIGDGAERDRLENEIDLRGLENVTMLGLQPRDRVPDWIASSDVLLVMLRDLPVFETVIPSKMFEFLAQQGCVVMAAPRRGECRQLLEDAKAGFAIDAEDAEALAATLRWVRDHPDEARERGEAGRTWVLRDFIRDEQARRMMTFIEKAIGEPA